MPASIGARKGAPLCPNHCQTYEYLGPYFVFMEWIPAIRLSLFSDAQARRDPGHGASNFSKCTIPVEDPGSPTGFRDEVVGSLQDIRRLERESEQRERNGEGRRMVWRDYAQDRSNADQHTIAPDFTQAAPVTHLPNGQPIAIRRGDAVEASFHGETA